MNAPGSPSPTPYARESRPFVVDAVIAVGLTLALLAAECLIEFAVWVCRGL